MAEQVLTQTGETECQVTGPTMEELLSNTVETIFENVVDLETVREHDERSFSIPWEGTSLDVFEDFLDNCIAILQEEKFLAKSCEVDIDSDVIEITLLGSEYQPQRHTLIAEVKGLVPGSVSLREDMHGTFEGEFTLDL